MKPIICGDLDGVYCDFTGGACAIHGRPFYAVTTWDWYREWGMTDAEFWGPIKEHPDFYGEFVPSYPWANELLRLTRSVGDLVIVTANPLHPGLAASKAEWIRKHIGKRVPVITACGGDGFKAADLKALVAGHDRILIDDADENIDAFRAAGGLGIEFPQPWNRLHGMTKHRIAYVKDCLGVFCGENAAA